MNDPSEQNFGKCCQHATSEDSFSIDVVLFDSNISLISRLHRNLKEATSLCQRSVIMPKTIVVRYRTGLEPASEDFRQGWHIS